MPVSGTDNNKFDVSSNNWYLFASGTVSFINRLLLFTADINTKTVCLKSHLFLVHKKKCIQKEHAAAFFNLDLLSTEIG